MTPVYRPSGKAIAFTCAMWIVIGLVLYLLWSL